MRRAAVLTLTLVAAVTLVTPAAVAGAASSTSAARRLLVTTADLPSGWTASPHDSTGDAETAAALAECVGVRLAKPVASVTGNDIVDPTGKLAVTSTVALYRSVAVARRQFAAYKSAKYGSCAKDYFSNKPFGGEGGPLPSDVQIAKVQLKRSGQDTVGWALRADIPQDGATLSVYSVQSAVLKGKAIIKTQFDGSGAQFPQEQGEPVLAKVAQRIKKAKL